MGREERVCWKGNSSLDLASDCLKKENLHISGMDIGKDNSRSTPARLTRDNALSISAAFWAAMEFTLRASNTFRQLSASSRSACGDVRPCKCALSL